MRDRSEPPLVTGFVGYFQGWQGPDLVIAVWLPIWKNEFCQREAAQAPLLQRRSPFPLESAV